jgi:type II secretory pathway component GspD/PulD (secretin)
LSSAKALIWVAAPASGSGRNNKTPSNTLKTTNVGTYLTVHPMIPNEHQLSHAGTVVLTAKVEQEASTAASANCSLRACEINTGALARILN